MHPEQTAWFTSFYGEDSYDYNCDSTETKQYTATGSCIVCVAEGDPYDSCSILATGTVGWSGPVPSCGQTSNRIEFVGTCSGEDINQCEQEKGCSAPSVTQGCH